MMYSVIISLYNEQEGVRSFWDILKSEIQRLDKYQFEIILVNDGSNDSTASIIKSIKDRETVENASIEIINFSRNFGHEAAMIAGIDNAIGNAIICMDGDGQHPPNQIEFMIKRNLEGDDIVLMERVTRNDNGFLKNKLTSQFYWLINQLSTVKFKIGTSDFFLISNQVKQILTNNYRENNRFIRGYLQSIGFNVFYLKYNAPDRLNGSSNYSVIGLIKLAVNAIFSFSNKPLRIGIVFSLLMVFFTLLLGGYTVGVYLFGNTPPSGYTTIILFLSVAFSFLFILLSIICLYFEKIIEETKRRPLYIIKDKL